MADNIGTQQHSRPNSPAATAFDVETSRVEAMYWLAPTWGLLHHLLGQRLALAVPQRDCLPEYSRKGENGRRAV